MGSKGTNLFMSVWCAVAILAVVAVLVPATASAFQRCVTGTEDRALTTRLLQTELMVGALACGNQDLYNDFVRRFRDELVQEGKSMQQVFKSEYRGSAGSHVNAFVTRLANEASRRSNVNRVGFCKQTALLFQEAMVTDPGNLQSLVAKVRDRADHGIRRCDAPVAGYGTASGSGQPATN